MRRLGAIIMQKILFCNLDLLAKGFEGYDQALSKKYRNEFVDYMVELSNEDENLICFISRENTRLGSAKKHFDELG